MLFSFLYTSRNVYTTQQDRDLCVYTFFWGIHDGVCCADPWAFVVYAMRSGELDIIADFDERNKKGERYSTSSDVDAD